MMKTLRLLLLIVMLAALAPAAATSAPLPLRALPLPAAAAQTTSINCASRPPLTRTSRVSATACFTVTPARGSTALRLDLAVTSGAYDLYVKSGSAATLAATDKVNVSAVSGALTYILANPGTGAYTVAVVSTGRSGAASLTPVTNYKATLKCSGATCTAGYSLAGVPGARSGDQAIFPVNITKAGRVEVKVTWQGAARLSAFLYGPSLSKQGVTQGSLARKDGASPLTLSYDVRSTDLIRGGKWSVGLINAGKAGGAVTGGQLSITYQR
jgi:hypothetical protein